MYRKLALETINGADNDPLATGRCVIQELLIFNPDTQDPAGVEVSVGATYATRKILDVQSIGAASDWKLLVANGVALDLNENLYVDSDKEVNVGVYGFKPLGQIGASGL